MSDKIDTKPIVPMTFDDEPKKNKPINPMVFDVPTKSFEDKVYIVLLVQDSNDNLFDGSFKICNGRTECYRYIQSLVESFGTDLDVHRSKIITETKQTEAKTGNSKYYMINIDESLSLYAFCKSVENYYSYDNFAIDEYFSSPEADKIIDYQEKLENEARRYGAHIDDQIIAQMAMETFKERQNMQLGMISNSNPTIENNVVSPILFDEDPSNI